MTSTSRTSRSWPALFISSLPQPQRRRYVLPSHELENAEALTSRLPSPCREEMLNHEFENTEALPLRPSSPIREEMMPALDDNRASTDVEDYSDESESENLRSTRRKHTHSLDSARRSLRNKKLLFI